MKTSTLLTVIVTVLSLCSCRSIDKRITGAYKNDSGDTLKLIADHSFRIELVEPDSTLGQFKYSTGRWSVKKRKVHFNMDSRSMGQYWECQPMKIGWHRLRRPVACAESGEMMVFKKVRIKFRKQRPEEEEGTRKSKKKKKEKKKKDEEDE